MNCKSFIPSLNKSHTCSLFAIGQRAFHPFPLHTNTAAAKHSCTHTLHYWHHIALNNARTHLLTVYKKKHTGTCAQTDTYMHTSQLTIRRDISEKHTHDTCISSSKQTYKHADECYLHSCTHPHSKRRPQVAVKLNFSFRSDMLKNLLSG